MKWVRISTTRRQLVINLSMIGVGVTRLPCILQRQEIMSNTRIMYNLFWHDGWTSTDYYPSKTLKFFFLTN